MRREGMAAGTKRKSRVAADSDHGRPAAEDLPDRRSEPEAADRAWTVDITYVATGEGWPYLAAVEGLHWRRIAGWSMGPRVGSRLVVDAPEVAVSRRLPGEGLVAHSDRGGRYAGEHDPGALAGPGVACSMSRRADCRGNAPMGGSSATPRKEPAHDEGYATRGEAKAGILECIEVFCNRARRHSGLGHLSPAEDEKAS